MEGGRDGGKQGGSSMQVTMGTLQVYTNSVYKALPPHKQGSNVAVSADQVL